MAQTQKKQQDMGTGDVKKLLLQLMIPEIGRASCRERV